MLSFLSGHSLSGREAVEVQKDKAAVETDISSFLCHKATTPFLPTCLRAIKVTTEQEDFRLFTQKPSSSPVFFFCFLFSTFLSSPIIPYYWEDQRTGGQEYGAAL
jgi:hypothetical protein